MSGLKFSLFRLKLELQERFRLLQSLNNLHAEINGLKEYADTQLKETSEGLRTTFAPDVGRAEQWLSALNPPEIKGMNILTPFSELSRVGTELERLANEGRQIQESLTVAFNHKADELGQRLTHQLVEVEREYIGHQQLLQLWVKEEQIQTVQENISSARRLLNEEQYVALEDRLKDVESDLSLMIKWTTEQEDKHQKRLYLLEALRQVCAEWHFEEISVPRYERKGDRGSRILFTVDTLDRGQIAFTLSLDGISSFSEIADDRCFEEFNQISQYLEAEFGIHTQFRPGDGEPPPKHIRKGEKDLPDGVSAQMEA